MAYVDPVDLLQAVKTALAALALDPTNDPQGARLFDAVGFYNLREPVKALNDLFLTQEKVIAVIVAGGDTHANNGGRDQVNVTSHRDTDFEIMYFDRVWATSDPAAVLGGDENIGVLRIKERGNAALLGKSLGIPQVVLLPQEGGLVDLFDPRNQEQGRTCWTQGYTTYCGSARVAVE